MSTFREEQVWLLILSRGKVFVFSGLLRVCNGDDGLATVLGHEIAHRVAHHASENLTRATLIQAVALLGSLLFDFSGAFQMYALDLAYNKPGSRAQEVR